MSKIDGINIEIRHMQQQIQGYLQMHWRLFLAEGVFLFYWGFAR